MPLEKKLYRGGTGPWSKDWRGWLSGTVGGRESGTDCVPAIVRFGIGLRGTGGRDLILSGRGLVVAASGGEVRDIGAS